MSLTIEAGADFHHAGSIVMRYGEHGIKLSPTLCLLV